MICFFRGCGRTRHLISPCFLLTVTITALHCHASVSYTHLDVYKRQSLFRLLSRERAPAILKEMASDDAVDLLGELSPKEIAELLPLVDEDTAKFSGLLKYPEESAGGIMTTEYISCLLYTSRCV